MTPSSSQGAIPHPGHGTNDETAVYRLYDAAGSLLYVGLGRNPMTRWASHAEQHAWWPRATAFRVDWFETRKEAAAEERRAIRDEDPECNIYGRPGWGEYVQARYAERNRLIQARQSTPTGQVGG